MASFNEPDLTLRTVTLVVRRVIRAPAERLFVAWTQPAELIQWWGPKDITCSHASIDLQVGGNYRIDNRLPSGDTLSIIGEYERVDPPRELVFSWRLDPTPDGRENVIERVTVRFEPRGDDTLVTVIHERIENDTIRADHERGWEGCLDGLVEYVT